MLRHKHPEILTLKSKQPANASGKGMLCKLRPTQTAQSYLETVATSEQETACGYACTLKNVLLLLMYIQSPSLTMFSGVSE